MKSQKPLQIVTAIFALSMLSIYVVQSQRHAASAVAPHPKQMPLATFADSSVRSCGGTTNKLSQTPPSPVVLPGSKSAPVFTVPGKKSN